MLIESNQNSKLKNWSKLKQKKYRNQEQVFLVEGEHLVLEALASNRVKDVLIREGAEANLNEGITNHSNLFTIKENLFNKLATTQSPQPVMAICTMEQQIIERKNRLLILDQIQDPGNMGTLIRSAVAFGFDGIIVGHGCVDLYNEKVIRSTQGAIFKIPIKQQELLSCVAELKSEGIVVMGTSLQNGVPLQTIPTFEQMAFIIGNEGNGVGTKLLTATDQNIYIEMTASVESLNVSIAGSIIMHQFHQIQS